MCRQMGILVLLAAAAWAQQVPVPRAQWRLAPLDAAALTNGAALTAALQLGRDYGITNVSGTSIWLAVRLPALTNAALLTFEHRGAPFTAHACESYDSSNGSDGTWTPLPLAVYFRSNDSNGRLQKLDLAPAAARWVRLALTNQRSATTVAVYNLGLYALDGAGADDYWLCLGASIQYMAIRTADFKSMVKSRFGYDPIIFNRAVSGWTTASLRLELTNRLAEHPRARYVTVHIGGNNVTANRPFPGGTNALALDLQYIYATITNAGRTLIVPRISYRQYSAAPVVDPLVPTSETNGSGPYNTAIVDALAARYAPAFYDWTNNVPLVDPYVYFKDNAGELNADGVHVGTAGQLSWNRLWAWGAGMVVYSNYAPPTAVTAPVAAQPPNGSTVGVQPQLAASAFAGGADATHTTSRWQISAEAGFGTLRWDSGDTPFGTTAMTVTAALPANATNWWRVRYRDQRGTWSAWSAPAWFISVPEAGCGALALLGCAAAAQKRGL